MNRNKINELVIFLYILYLFIIGLFLQPLDSLIKGLYHILTSPGMLITDYMVVGGIGPALVNGSLVGLIGLLLIKINKVPMTGPSIATIFIMTGFGLFGKNIWSIFPIIVGVYLYSKLKRHKFRTYIYPALFGTALAPMVTQNTFVLSVGIWGGILIGIVAGILLPPLATHLLKVHEGYNLYNVGFAAGFVGLLLYNILKGYGFNSEIVILWGDFNKIIFIIIPMVVSMIILGFLLNKRSLNGYKEIFKYPGVLITDYTAIAGFGNTLINMGLVGLIGIIYIELINGNYNGPTLGALFTMIGFGAFGKNPKNIVPIMLGVYLGTIFSFHNANEAGPLLAALFGTALAPLAGKFGPIVGILAGFTHLSIVSYVGGIYGGLNLYNNGFSAGIVATIFVAIISGIKEDV